MLNQGLGGLGDALILGLAYLGDCYHVFSGTGFRFGDSEPILSLPEPVLEQNRFGE